MTWLSKGREKLQLEDFKYVIVDEFQVFLKEEQSF